MNKEERTALVATIYDRLRRESINPAKVRVIWRQEDGSYLFATSDTAIERLTASELHERESLIADILDVREDAMFVIRSLPDYVGDLAAVRNLRSIRPSIDDAAQIIGTRIILTLGDEAGRTIRTFRSKNACIVRPAQEDKQSEPYALAIGKTAQQAIATTLILEKSCLALIEGSVLGGVIPINRWIAYKYRRMYVESYGKCDERAVSQTADDFARTIGPREMTMRQAIIDCGNQLVEENLVQGTWGNVSLRLDDRAMLVTPSGLEYHRLTPYDIVRVDMRTLESEGTIQPSSEAGMHAAILLRYPEVDCIIHSHAVQSSVFAACRQPIPVIHPEDKKLLGESTGYAKGELSGTDKLVNSVVRGLEQTSSGTCVIGSHGIVAAGNSMENAFEKCRAMERAARRHLDMKIRELRG